jgi:hypothetical protein
MIIKRVDPVSCAKIAGTLYAIFGVVVGGIVSLVALAGGFGSNTSAPAAIRAIIGVGSVVVFPIFYGSMAFVAALTGAWLYNVLAKAVGGIQLEVQ